jgi:LPS export ABC transporter protein LptC
MCMRRVCLVAAILLVGCGQQATTPGATMDSIDLEADNVIIGAEHRMTNLGVLTAVMRSDTAYAYEQTNNMDLRGNVTVSFRDERGSEAGTLTSRTGDYNMGINLFVARGDVVLITDGPNGPRRLETDELHYDINGDRLWTDRPFTFHESGRVSRGNSFRTDSQFLTWEVTGIETQGSPSESGFSF